MRLLHLLSICSNIEQYFVTEHYARKLAAVNDGRMGVRNANEAPMKRPAADRKQTASNREYIAGLEKGLATIEAFSNGRERLSVTEAAESVGLSRAAARRCLLTLEHLGYAEYDGKYFRLAPRALRLGHAYISSNILARLVQPVIEATSERLGESMAAAVLDDTSTAVIARTAVRRSLSAGLAVGMRLRSTARRSAACCSRRCPTPKPKPLSSNIPR